MKKYVVYIEMFFVFAIFVLVLSVTVYKFKNYNKLDEYTIVEDVKKDSKSITYKDGIVSLDYSDLDQYIVNIDNKKNVSTKTIKKIYNNIINYTFDKILSDESVKMYKEDNKTILEYIVDSNIINDLFDSIIKVKDDVIVKINFETDKEYQDIDVEAMYYELNHEEVIRENIVKTLQAQVDNTGEKYWNWYGYSHRVEWCAVFVSWVAYENGQLQNGNIPKFIWVKKGVDFFKEKKQFKYRKEYTPKPADVIFFDWNNNGVIDHVGYVEKVTDKYVYTIEGNVGYMYVRRKKYDLKSGYIYGYGVPNY